MTSIATHRPFVFTAMGTVVSVHSALPLAYLPRIYDPAWVDRLMDVTQTEAEAITRRLAREEGICCGVSAGGAAAAALRLSQEVENAVIVTIVCDRGDRYLSTNVFG